jgi:hypothetical protein
VPVLYYSKMPPDIAERTSSWWTHAGTAEALRRVRSQKEITAAATSAQEHYRRSGGIARMQKDHPDVDVYVRGRTRHQWIGYMSRLGDAGTASSARKEPGCHRREGSPRRIVSGDFSAVLPRPSR